MQPDTCSYDQSDLRVKQLNDPESSLVIDYFESVAKPKLLLPSLFKRFEPQLHLDDGILLYYPFILLYYLVYGIPEKNLLGSRSSFRRKCIYSIDEKVRY